MKVQYHLLSAAPIGVACYALTGNVTAACLGAGASVVIDIDHAIDYILTQKKIASLDKIMEAFESFAIVKKNYFFFHSWEIIIALGLFQLIWPHPYIAAILLGYGIHLLIDQIYNTCFLGKYNLKLWFYFFLYRLRFNFDVMPLRKNGNSIDEHEKIYA